ncbi:hypothetical protein [Tritonibacter scottomollicae]|uniref:Uncharacterized protein n=1 Tax=Tritonibacter scottomollicae TaxID=483013 RepID=A0A2T1ABN6_TRISK|nr:hypothetical protein [Tritonibacter scottomollicae]PRZ46010.1 hypothetical protein CLV89_112122 [Tritonibacter scottomollicae]
MSIPGFSPFPQIPKRSTPEADFDAKMYALFQHFAVTHRNELLAFIEFLETNVTAIEGAINGVSVGLTHPAAGKFTDLEVLGTPGVLARFRDGVASNFYVQTEGNKTTIGNAAGSSRLALMAGNAEAIEFDSVGRASGAAVQASAVDASDGKLLTTGAGGILTTNPPNLADPAQLDAPAGLYNIAAADGWPFDGALLQLRRNAGRGVQIAARGSSSAPNASSEILVRTSGNAFGGWAQLLHSENLLGTVSHSGGTPTGAVIERGSNANGEYVRFADGTQICMSEVSTSASGGVTWTFPAAFAALVHYGGAAIAAAAPLFIACSSPTATSLLIHGWSAAEARSAFNCKVVAIGRWF